MPWAVWAADSLPATHHPFLAELRHLTPGLISLAPHDYLFPPLTKVVPEMNKVFGQQWKQYSSAGVPWYVVFKVSSYLWSQILASPVYLTRLFHYYRPPPSFFFSRENGLRGIQCWLKVTEPGNGWAKKTSTQVLGYVVEQLLMFLRSLIGYLSQGCLYFKKELKREENV